MLDRFTSSLLVFGITLRSFFWNTYRSARRRSRLTLGVAVGTIAALAGILAGVLAGSEPAAHTAASNPSGTRNSAAVRPAGHPQQAVNQHGTSQHGTSQHGGGQQAAAQHGAAQHGAGQHGAGQQTTGQHGNSQHGAARQSSGQHTASAQRPAQTPVPGTAARPYSIYDSVTPSAIPANQHAIATYANGHYAATSGQVAGRGSVLWIDTNATNPSASVLDVEPGDATPAAAASWAWHKLNSDPSSLARIYTMRSEWPAVRAAISALPSQMQSHVRYWIADPTGVDHLVPGSNATQWYWGTHYDITTANPGF